MPAASFATSAGGMHVSPAWTLRTVFKRSLAAEYSARITRFVIIDAPLPGVGPWDEIVRSQLVPEAVQVDSFTAFDQPFGIWAIKREMP
jgi:hypothetical protein